MVTEQQPATPYSANTLDVHDKDLVFSREFGTNVSADIGQPVNMSEDPNVPGSINARLGMLEIDSTDDENNLEAPRGFSFLLPDWDTLPPSGPVIDDLTAQVVFGHVLLRQVSFDISSNDRADLIFGPADMVGEDSVETPFAIASILGDIPGGIPAPTEIAVSGYATDFDSGADDVVDGTHWGQNLYWRCLMVSDNDKFSDILIDVSRDGLTWFPTLNFGFDVVIQRIGLTLGGSVVANLDWIRSYSYVIESESAGAFLNPLFPLTGGRLFVP